MDTSQYNLLRDPPRSPMPKFRFSERGLHVPPPVPLDDAQMVVWTHIVRNALKMLALWEQWRWWFRLLPPILFFTIATLDRRKTDSGSCRLFLTIFILTKTQTQVFGKMSLGRGHYRSSRRFMAGSTKTTTSSAKHLNVLCRTICATRHTRVSLLLIFDTGDILPRSRQIDGDPTACPSNR